MKTLSFEISEESFELLKKIDAKGYAEFRDNEYDNFSEFQTSDEYMKPFSDGTRKDSEWFYSRNFCDADKLEELLKYNLIGDGMSWHTTYYVSDLGKECLKQTT